MRLWAIVTVQLAASRRLAIGLPTILERPDDDGAHAGEVLAAHTLDQQHRACGRAGHEGGIELAGSQLADIDEVETVDVLFGAMVWIIAPEIDVSRQRQLDEDAVDLRDRRSALPIRSEQFGLARLGRQVC